MSSGIATIDGTCPRCNGPLVANVTRVVWSGRAFDKYENGDAKKYHAECYFLKPNETAKMRDKEGRFTDGSHTPIPDSIPVEDVEEHKAIVSSKPAVAKSNGTGKADSLLELITEQVFDKVETRLNVKVDEKQVREIASDIVKSGVAVAVQAALESHTRTIVINDKATGETKKLEGLQHKQFADLLALVQSGLNVYMYDAKGKGGPGAGKTFAAGQVAEALGKTFYHISLSVQSQPSLIMGFKNAQGDYVSTPFRQAYETGGIFLFDEISNGSGNLLTSLNTALANGSCAFPDKVVERHADFVCIAADNTAGRGGNAMHNSRQVLDEAFRERFVFLGWEYDEKLERKAAKAQNNDADAWVTWIQKVRTQANTLNLKLVVSPRASIYGAMLLKSGHFKTKDVADMVLFKGIDEDTRSKVLNNVPLS